MTGETPQEVAQKPPQKKAKRSWPRRLLRGVAWSLAGLFGLILVLLLVLLYSQAAIRLVLSVGIGIYNDMIPGEVTIARVEGRLGTRLQLDGLEIRDGQNATIARVDSLVLRLHPWALLTGTAHIEELSLTTGEVLVDGAWGDLAPVSDEPPPEPEPDAGFGPDLPLEIVVASFTIADTNLLQTNEGGTTPLVEALDLSLAARAGGRRARVEIAGISGRLRQPEVELEHLGLIIDWADPRADIRVLDLRTSLGGGTIRHARINLESLRGHILANFDVPATTAALAGLEGDGQLVLAALRNADGTQLYLDTGVGSQVAAILQLQGQLDREVQASLSGELAPTLLGLAPGTSLVPELRATYTGPLSDAQLALNLDCSRCGAFNSQLALDVAGDIEQQSLTADVDLTLDGGKVHASAMVVEGQPISASVEVAVAKLSRLKLPVDGVPPLRGGVDMRVDCQKNGSHLPCKAQGEVRQFSGVGIGFERMDLKADAEVPLDDTVELGFDARVGLRGLRAADQSFDKIVVRASGTPKKLKGDVKVTRSPGETFHAAARVEPGPPLKLVLENLDSELGTFTSKLNRPGVVVVDGPKVVVKQIDLDVAGGKLLADGTFNRAGRSNIDVAVENFDLGRLRGVVPSFPARGYVNVQASLKGQADKPAIEASVRADKLAVAGQDLGDISVDTSLSGQRLRAATSVTLAGTQQPTVVAEAVVPVRLDLESGEFAQLAGKHMASVQLHPFDLAWANRFLPADGPQLAGEVTGEVELAGTGRQPRLNYEVRGEDLAFGPLALGDPTLTGAYDNRHVTAEFSMEQGFADALRLNAEVPATVQVSPFLVNVHKNRELAVHAEVVGFDLVTIEPLLGVLAQLSGPEGPTPSVPVGGKVDVDVKLAGSFAEPQLDLQAATRGLRFGDNGLGDLRVDVGHRDDVLAASLQHRGGLLEQLDVVAEVPFVVDTQSSKFAWQPTAPHRLMVQAQGFDPANTKLLGVEHDVAGDIDLRLDAAVTQGAPELRAVAEIGALTYVEKDLVQGAVGFDVDSSGAQLVAKLKGAGRSRVELEGHVPLAVSLEGPPEWLQAQPHSFKVDAQLGRELLAVVVPEKALGKRASLRAQVDATGNLQEFTATSQVHGEVRTHQKTRQALDIAVEVGPTRQGVDFAFDPGGTASRVELHASTNIPVADVVTGAYDAGEAPATAELTIPYFPLQTLNPWLPAAVAEPEGYAQGQIAVSGTVAMPKVNGGLELKDAAISVVPLQQRIRGINMDLAATGQTVELRQLVFEGGAGKGAVTAKASFDPQTGVRAEADLELDKFTIAPPGLPEIQISSRVHTDARAKDADTKVSVGVRDTTIWLDDSQTGGAKSIPRSEHVAFVDAKGKRAARKAAAQAESGTPDESGTLDFELKLHDPIFLRGELVEMNWGGTVKATIAADRQTISGGLSANRGFVDLFGTKLEIENGEVTLVEGPEGVDPYLNLVASSDIAGFRVTAVLRGRASSPEIEFTSEPPLPAYQVLALLITGNAEVDDTTRDEVEAKAASLLAVVASPGLQRSMRKNLGIDRIRLSFGESLMQPVLSVGKRVSKKVYTEASYKQNAPTGENTVQLDVQYNFRPEWSLDTYFGDAAKGGVDVFWRRHFGEPKARGRRAKAKTGEAKSDKR